MEPFLPLSFETSSRNYYFQGSWNSFCRSVGLSEPSGNYGYISGTPGAQRPFLSLDFSEPTCNFSDYWHPRDPRNPLLPFGFSEPSGIYVFWLTTYQGPLEPPSACWFLRALEFILNAGISGVPEIPFCLLVSQRHRETIISRVPWNTLLFVGFAETSENYSDLLTFQVPLKPLLFTVFQEPSGNHVVNWHLVGPETLFADISAGPETTPSVLFATTKVKVLQDFWIWGFSPNSFFWSH